MPTNANKPKLISFLMVALPFTSTSNVLQTSPDSIGMPVGHFLVLLALLAAYVCWEKRHGAAARTVAVAMAFGGAFGLFLAALLMAFDHRASMVLILGTIAACEIAAYQIMMIVIGFIRGRMSAGGDASF